MNQLFLLGSQIIPCRPTNTVQHANDLWLNKVATYEICSSNKDAIEKLVSSKNTDWLALIPFYNVFGSSVRDTLEWIGKSLTSLNILAITKMKIEYWLVCKKWTSIDKVENLWTHVQSFFQTTEAQLAMFGKRLQHINTGSTSGAIEFIHSANNAPELDIYAWAIAPHQYIPNIDDNTVDVHSREFWPKNNFTYFMLMGYKGSSHSSDIIHPDNLTDEVGCEIMNIPDIPWSLHKKLTELNNLWVNILGIVSINKWENETEFIYTYTNSTNFVSGVEKDIQITDFWIKNIAQIADSNAYSCTMKIPQKKWSLKDAVGIFSNLWFDIREIQSTPTWYKTVDFLMEFRDIWNTEDTSERLYQLWASMNSLTKVLLSQI